MIWSFCSDSVSQMIGPGSVGFRDCFRDCLCAHHEDLMCLYCVCQQCYATYVLTI